MTLGGATYEPRWKWSDHSGPATGESSCKIEHAALVLSGQAVAKVDAGHEVVMRGGLLVRPAGSRQLGRERRTVRLATHRRQRGLRAS
jgi:hypothetical protein